MQQCKLLPFLNTTWSPLNSPNLPPTSTLQLSVAKFACYFTEIPGDASPVHHHFLLPSITCRNNSLSHHHLCSSHSCLILQDLWVTGYSNHSWTCEFFLPTFKPTPVSPITKRNEDKNRKQKLKTLLGTHISHYCCSLFPPS